MNENVKSVAGIITSGLWLELMQLIIKQVAYSGDRELMAELDKAMGGIREKLSDEGRQELATEFDGKVEQKLAQFRQELTVQMGEGATQKVLDLVMGKLGEIAKQSS
jgi:hypothetical protein